MKIGGITIGVDENPVVIAELSGNHNQNKERAFKLIDAAHDAGVQVIKLQTYTPDTITMNIEHEEFVISDPQSLWFGRSLFSLYQEAHTPWDWQSEIFSYAKTRGMVCFSSVFDFSSVEFLEGLNITAYKIASQEITHLPLIELVASTGKPIIMSTGMASLSEIDCAVNLVRKTSKSEIALLKCSSSYPAPVEHSNVKTIPFMRDLFDCEVGLSDHTIGIGAPLAAIAQGATIIEKHLTLDRGDGGVDSKFSTEPHEFRQLVREAESCWKALGRVSFGPTSADNASLSGRQSIYISENLNKGDILKSSNMRIIRPNKGLSPKYYSDVKGKRVKCDVERGTALTWELIE